MNIPLAIALQDMGVLASRAGPVEARRGVGGGSSNSPRSFVYLNL